MGGGGEGDSRLRLEEQRCVLVSCSFLYLWQDRKLVLLKFARLAYRNICVLMNSVCQLKPFNP